MTKLLYITAHPLDELGSNSMAAGKTFVDSYKENHPSDEVKHIDLFNEDIPMIDKDVLTGWGKLRNGDELTSEEQQKVNRLSEILDEFLEADKYVFVSPMWNLSFPPVLKAYIDAISIAGKTFKYTAEGPQGLLTDKKVLHIQSRGGYYTEGPAAEVESGDRYLRNIMTFLGVPSYETIIIEGHNAEPEKTEEIKAASIAEAKELAKTF
ncbi:MULTISPECIES: FMN-dependent NADH-azoreductase [Staphylococcus]|uniref:FMN-dependent NADH:quinone oxidoreductase n=1 Tax=Staphylococcus haemolyticus (strain JCSC1435) TaxID=279808 RepID=AZOR_STAHJ|nr:MULTISPECIES: FMN-dependent NADH-azoreductase [Staphylococcus]Q4L9I0.1 RecName: Full=FMN-dependent NADH:quinone oxidoreductase; AltName: Full=Azo-dye reductase; AltName: Full=FMN-dependent NADH-azo compound oxidoreductase; AltName: Full=FMN-dependent NADH-azoreductase [Staphylococcus haemolyticus JCSC1435]AYX84269.1 FMN-dependent NADH-azoreductase [Staphylococcus haemolyticus]MBW3857455.1 FMN-dependent NADH-azoreductase [Staphylococcus haemolyticus]MBW5902821.1 FMN-dependent NADH-azoreductas